MNIDECINKNYDSLLKIVRQRNRLKYYDNCRCSEDIFHDILIQAKNRFGEEQYDEEEFITYIKKSLFSELKYQTKRVDKTIVKIGDIRSYNQDLYEITDN